MHIIYTLHIDTQTHTYILISTFFASILSAIRFIKKPCDNTYQYLDIFPAFIHNDNLQAFYY